MNIFNLVEKICLGTGLCHLWSVNLLLFCNIGTEDELWLNPKMLISDFFLFLFFLAELGGCGERLSHGWSCVLLTVSPEWSLCCMAGVAFDELETLDLASFIKILRLLRWSVQWIKQCDFCYYSNPISRKFIRILRGG